MNRADVISLIGTGEAKDSEYVPVACLLNSGYGCLGYFNHAINDKLEETLVILNARLVDLRAEEGHSRRGQVSDFNDFLQDVVARHVRAESEAFGDSDNNENTIPLTAVPISEIAILYPVAHIAALLKSMRKVKQADGGPHDANVPTFLDFNNRSVVLKVLRTKLW
ncbi:MAG: hypothetical protein NT138_01570 [Planctomycetales bacterium]|jgi:hypothetical protein|nr:hypothetical protein [Planctomycetales bacterium]